jgi:hypothetical protein
MPVGLTRRARSEPAARLAYSLAAVHCRGRQSYHAVWPHLRLIDPPRGLDADGDRFLEVLGPLPVALRKARDGQNGVSDLGRMAAKPKKTKSVSLIGAQT